MTDDGTGTTRDAPPIDEFEAAFGEPLRSVLDVETWSSGENLGEMYEQIAAAVESAVRQERYLRDPIRSLVFPQIRERQLVPDAGVYQATSDDLKRIHQGLLFRGAVEACDATRYTHETVPLTVAQIGVSLVAYNGHLGTWVQRLFRRDLREEIDDPVAAAMTLLERRDERTGPGRRAERDELNELARRAIMTYAERAILVRRSNAPWKMGHGNPAAHELLTGTAGSLDLVIEATRVLEELICEHKKFVFVPSEPTGRLLLTIGDALRPLEYAIVYPLSTQISPFLEDEDYDRRTTSDTTIDGRELSPREWIARFRDVVAAQVAVGVFRASEVARAHLFYAHVDHAHEAALIALADSVLQPHRGFPLLIDVAHHVCAATFGPDSLAGPLQLAYTRAGAPLRYASERMTRGR